MELPEINNRIKKLVKKYADDNFAKFCRMVDIKPSYKLTRLFSIEPRNGKYPLPSLEVIKQIADKLDIDINYLVYGESKSAKNFVNEERNKYLTSDEKLNLIMKQNIEILDKLNEK